MMRGNIQKVAALLFALALSFSFVNGAEAANRFRVGGTSNWDASSTTNWSTTTGGAGGASAPTTGDVAIFDANSGAGTVTITAAQALDNVDMTGSSVSLSWSSFAVTLNGLNAATVLNGITGITGGSVLKFTNTGMTLKSNGNTVPPLTIDLGGGLSLVDALVASSANTFNLVNGSFNANNQPVTVNTFSLNNNANARTVTFGTQPWTINNTLELRKGAGTVTLTDVGTATIIFTPTSTPFNMSWQDDQVHVYGTVKFNPTSVAGWININLPSSAETITNSTFGGGTQVNVNNTLTLTNTPTVTASGTRPIFLNGNVTSVRTISSANPVTLDHALISDITAAGGGAFTATNSFDGGGNTGWTITAPSGGASIFGG